MAQQTEYIGTYKILDKIGEGGMAYIYKALQPSLKRAVVIKKLKDPNREIIKRFKKEALLSASFHHENLIAVYDFIYSNRSYYLVMEYVDGEDLRTIIDHLAPLPPEIAALIALSVARGLEYTHSHNIIHRDIKPSNILVSYDGNVKLIDFGIARDDLSTRLTVTGMIVGTPAYMSPEQANGDELTPQSDLFSLGILLYEMLTGVKPFDGTRHSEVISQIVRGNYLPPGRINPAIPLRLRRIIKKCLQHSPRKRYQNATQLINDLERFLPWQTRNQKKRLVARFLNRLNKNEPSTVQTIIPALVNRFSSRRWWLAKGGLIVLTLALVFSLFRYLQIKQTGRVIIEAPPKVYRIAIDGKPWSTAAGPNIYLPGLLQGGHYLTLREKETANALDVFFSVKPQHAVKIHVPNRPPVDRRAALSVLTEPEQATLLVDGTPVGFSPFYSDSLIAGAHTLTVLKEGFARQTLRVACQPGETKRMLIVLSKK